MDSNLGIEYAFYKQYEESDTRCLHQLQCTVPVPPEFCAAIEV